MPWRTMRATARVAIRRQTELAVEGSEFLPVTGPVLLAARHFHHLFDGAALVATIPRPVAIIAGLDWIQNPALKGGMKAACKAAGWPVVYRDNAQHPVAEREIRAANLSATRATLDLLRLGKIVVVFPEAYPNIDPGYTPKQDESDFLPFEPGVVRLATMAKRAGIQTPIVPVGFSYRRDQKWQITMRFGPPVTVASRADESEALTLVESEVKRLSRPA